MIHDHRRIAAEAGRLETLLASFHDIRGRSDDDRAKALVTLRRQLAMQIGAIAMLVRPLLDRGGDRLRDEFRHIHSTLLATLAHHQADWPAVLLLRASDDAAYIRSASTVDRACHALIAWLRRVAMDRPPAMPVPDPRR